MVDLQTLFQEDHIVSMRLEAMNQHHYMLNLTRYGLRRNDVASFINLLKDLNTLSLLLKLMLSFYQKCLIPQLQLMLRFPAYHLSLFPMRLWVITILAEGPIMVPNPTTKNTSLQPLPKLVFILLPEGFCYLS